MKKPALQLTALLCLVAGILTLVTAVSVGRRQEARLASGRIESGRIESVVEATPAGATSPAAAGWLTEYTLTRQDGRPFRSRDLKGQVHVASFFFASCPTVCRLQNGKIQELAAEFGAEGVVFVSITCDPANDTPAALANYAELFDADPDQWAFLTSDQLNYLRRVGAEVYGLPVDKQVHSERLIVVDRGGEIRGRYHWNQPTEIVEMKKTLRQLLDQA